MALYLRKFFCKVKTCTQIIFVEQLAPFIEQMALVWSLISIRSCKSSALLQAKCRGMRHPSIRDTNFLDDDHSPDDASNGGCGPVSQLGIDGLSFTTLASFFLDIFLQNCWNRCSSITHLSSSWSALRWAGGVYRLKSHNIHPWVSKAKSVAPLNVATMLHCPIHSATRRKKTAHAKELATAPCKT